jgi:hypothetical protein
MTLILVNTIISTEHESQALKTRTHDKRFEFWLSNEADSVGFVTETIATTDLKTGEITTKKSILSYYFGFPNFASAYRFVEYCKSRFLMLTAYHSHCEARESQRLTHYPVEVKVRSLTAFADVLEDFAKACIVKKMSANR